jgi:hypothetical protein
MTEPELWTHPETVGSEDVTRFKVEALDGSIGKVDEVTQPERIWLPSGRHDFREEGHASGAGHQTSGRR